MTGQYIVDTWILYIIKRNDIHIFISLSFSSSQLFDNENFQDHSTTLFIKVFCSASIGTDVVSRLSHLQEKKTLISAI